LVVVEAGSFPGGEVLRPGAGVVEGFGREGRRAKEGTVLLEEFKHDRFGEAGGGGGIEEDPLDGTEGAEVAGLPAFFEKVPVHSLSHLTGKRSEGVGLWQEFRIF
jgi:hypothetical protein